MPQTRKRKFAQSTTGQLSDNPTKRKVRCYIEYLPQEKTEEFEKMLNEISTDWSGNTFNSKKLKNGEEVPRGKYYRNLPSKENVENYQSENFALWKFYKSDDYGEERSKEENMVKTAIDELVREITGIEGINAFEKAIRKGYPLTEEVGYKQIAVQGSVNEWNYINHSRLMRIANEGEQSISTKAVSDPIQLPVSCSTASEHIISQYKDGKGSSTFNDWKSSINKSNVTLCYRNNGSEEILKVSDKPNGEPGEVVIDSNGRPFDLGSDNIPDNFLTTYKDKPFFTTSDNSASLEKGQGILAYKYEVETIQEKNVGDHHAVVVIAKHNTGNLIVLERDAGKTTGLNKCINNDWLLNTYNHPSDFLEKYGKSEHAIGFLLKYYGPEANSSASTSGQAGTSLRPDPF